jgi:hypothetical protein
MAAVSHRPPSAGELGRRAGLLTAGVVGMGVAALLGPVVLGLMSAVMLHTVRVSGGRLPILLLATINLFDLAVLGGVAYAGWWAWGQRTR